MKKTLPFLRKRLGELYGVGEAQSMIGLIFHSLLGWNATDLIINDDKELSPFIQSKIEEILKRLEAHEPLQYILGEAWFYGMNFLVDRRVLIPRPETAELVDMIVKRYADKTDLSVLDVGSGSGAIAIALARNLRFANIVGLDVSPGAIIVAKENAKRLKAKVEFREGDIFSFHPQDDSFDIIVSNPPYVLEKEKRAMDANVLDWEPHVALFVPDSDPLRYYKRIAEVALVALKPGGSLFFEINPLCSSDLKEMLKSFGLDDVDIVNDIHGKNRFVSCDKPLS